MKLRKKLLLTTAVIIPQLVWNPPSQMGRTDEDAISRAHYFSPEIERAVDEFFKSSPSALNMLAPRNAVASGSPPPRDAIWFGMTADAGGTSFYEKPGDEKPAHAHIRHEEETQGHPDSPQ